MYQKSQVSFLSLIVLLLLASTLFTSTISAQDEQALIIEIYDSNNGNEIAGTILYEGKNYDITVSTENDSFILGVNVSLLGITYFTSTETPFVTIAAPRFDEYDSFNITATKEGYLTAKLEITVMKGELSIVADRGTVEEKKEFQVTVKDQDNKPVEGALVYITTDAAPIMTDLQGMASARAPEVEMITTASIQVIKSGYLPGSTTIRVENVEGSIFDLTESKFLQILPILIAILVVIFAIAYVLWRQKRNPTIPHQSKRAGSSDEPQAYQQEKQGQRSKNEPALFPGKEKSDVSLSRSASRVEEIRIPVQVKKKETTYLSEEKEQDEVSEDPKNEHDEWFKGQDYMRYKLDELTGKIDQKTDGKWFEGERDSKYKVDETLKKSAKKKKVDEEDVK
ncbi:MAG: Ig-like domain-containing protein [Euryarchaeota archaeon]|nr:Ig-like domain-containing protein [Euryarchaeota archaeon]